MVVVDFLIALWFQLKDDSEFQEFLEVHKVRANKALWSNDTGAVGEDTGAAETTTQQDKKDTEATKADTSKVVFDDDDGDDSDDDDVVDNTQAGTSKEEK